MRRRGSVVLREPQRPKDITRFTDSVSSIAPRGSARDDTRCHLTAVRNDIFTEVSLVGQSGPFVAGLLFDVIGSSWTIAIGAMTIVLAWCMSVVVIGPRRALAPIRSHVVHLRHHRHKR